MSHGVAGLLIAAWAHGAWRMAHGAWRGERSQRSQKGSKVDSIRLSQRCMSFAWLVPRFKEPRGSHNVGECNGKGMDDDDSLHL